jgi:hypothetical protein
MASIAILLWVVTRLAKGPERHGQRLQIYVAAAGVASREAYAICLSRLEH